VRNGVISSRELLGRKIYSITKGLENPPIPPLAKEGRRRDFLRQNKVSTTNWVVIPGEIS
jgi:hypothetical protein